MNKKFLFSLFFSSIFLSLPLLAMQEEKKDSAPQESSELPDQVRNTILYADSRINNINQDLKTLTDQYKNYHGRFLNHLRMYYYGQEVGFWGYLNKPIVNSSKTLAYLKFLYNRPASSDLSHDEYKKIYWPILSLHLDFSDMVEYLIHEYHYANILQHNIFLNAECQTDQVRKKSQTAFAQLTAKTKKLLELLTHAKQCTAIHTFSEITKESIRSNPLAVFMRSIHCISYKESLKNLESVFGMKKLNEICKTTHNGNSLFHLLVDEELPPVLFKSIAQICTSEYKLTINDLNALEKTPLEYAAGKKNISGDILAIIKNLGGIIPEEKKVRFKN